MRIVFDNIIFFLQNTGGISNYWYQLLIRLGDNSNIKFYSRSKSKNIFYNLLESKFNKFNTTNLNYPLFIDRFLDFKSNLFISDEKFIFHSSYYRINKNKYAINIITVHDFIHEKFYSGIRRYISLIQKRKAIYNADLIITVSKSTKKDLIEIYPDINQNIIKVVYNGVSDNFFKISDINHNDDTLLYIGAREKYKNFHSIVKILSNLFDYKLVIVGPQLTRFETNFLNNNLKDRWTFFTKVSEKKLNELYNLSFALIYPSLYEGFGIPLLEAMKSGCPFIALNNSSIPEVAGDAGILINKLTEEEVIKALKFIKLNRISIQKKGFIQSNKFSWENCFSQTYNLYAQLINNEN